MAVDREGLIDQIARIIDLDAHHLGRPDYYGPEPILAGSSARVRVARKTAGALIAGPLADLLTKADSAERMEVERDEARATNRDLHRRTQKAERFRVRRGGSFIHLIKLRLAEGRARRAAQADVARLSAEVEMLRRALGPFANAFIADHECWPDEASLCRGITFGHLREARAALSRADKADSRERGALLAQAEGGEHV